MLLIRDGAGNLVERRCRPTDRLAARALGSHLDRKLAAGWASEESRLLATRAQQLVSRRNRSGLAAGWESAIRRALAGPRALDVRLPLRGSRVIAARPEIQVLTGLLRDGGPPTARGVAIASRLLTDGTGPLYDRASPVALREALQAAIDNLDGSTGLFTSSGVGGAAAA